MKKFRLEKLGLFFICVIFIVFPVTAQSTSVDFPTPITSDEIKGKIPARDIGDSRLTTHYYVFEGRQGDIFISVEANNLNGDIDIFFAENLKPLTKISLYADSSPTQTGREIYLRKPEKLILRVEGRTPNDDAANYSIKFTGSFQSVAANSVAEAPKLPEIKSDNEGEVKVNSVGTIIHTKPKPAPIQKKTVAKNTTSKKETAANTTPKPVSTVKPKAIKSKIEPVLTKESEKKVEVVVTDNLPKPSETEATAIKETIAPKTKTTTLARKTTAKKTTTNAKKTATKATKPKTPEITKPKNTENEELTQALENIRLVVLFKDGGKIERPMNEVVRFSMDKGILTIINKDGTIGRYSILEISKISVE